MGSAIAAGLLGFIKGAADGGQVVAKYEMDAEAERRRLYTQELKERRMAEFGMQLKRDDDNARLATLGGDEFWNDPANAELNKLAKIGGSSAVASALGSDYGSERELSEQMAKEERDKIETIAREERAEQARIATEKRAEEQRQKETKGYAGGTTFMTGAQADAAAADPSKRTLPVISTPAAMTRSIGEAVSLASKSLGAGITPYGPSQEKLLQSTSFQDMAADTDKEGAYMALTTQLAVSKVAADLQVRGKSDPELALSIDAQTVQQEMEAKRAKIDASIRRVGDLYSAAIARVPDLTNRTLPDAAADMLEKGFLDNKGVLTNPRQMLESQSIWAPALKGLMIETMTTHYELLMKKRAEERRGAMQ